MIHIIHISRIHLQVKFDSADFLMKPNNPPRPAFAGASVEVPLPDLAIVQLHRHNVASQASKNRPEIAHQMGMMFFHETSNFAEDARQKAKR